MKILLKYCIFIPLLLFLIGCDEDPITPPPASDYEFDSARFNWSVDTLPGWGYAKFSMYSPDTNTLYATNDVADAFVIIKDCITSTIFFNDFSPHYVWGLNSNEIYIGGGKNIGSIYLPHIKKWNGVSFEDIYIPTKDSLEGVISTGIINSSSDMWFANKNKIFRYENGSFTEYKVSDSSRIPYGFFLKDGYKPTIISNELNENIDTIFRNYIYEWENGEMHLTFMNTWYPGNPNYTWLQLTNDEIYGMNERMIYTFNIPYLSPYVEPPGNLGFSSGDMIAGNSLNDFIVLMYDYKNSYGNLENLHHWDGYKFSNEGVGITILSGGIKNMLRMNDDYFICVYQDWFKSGDTYIFKGTRKKN